MSIDIKKITKNIQWLILDKLLIIILQFFIGVKVANFYGGELYGKYSYAVSIIAFSGIFLELLDGRVVKKYYSDSNFKNIIYNITFFKVIVAIIIFFILILYRELFKVDNILFFLLIFICLDNILIALTFGIENFFEFKLESRRIVISNNIVKIISYIFQYIGMILNLGIIFIPIMRCIGSLIRILILKYQYKKIYLSKVKIKERKINIQLLQTIINESKFLWLTYISFLIYTQIDKVMIKHYLGIEKVGIYSIGTQLSGVLAVLIGPIQNSLFPKLLELYKEDYKKYSNFYLLSNTIITQFYIFVTFISIFVVKYTFNYVYSEEYKGAITVYSILAFSILIKANGSLQTGHMTIKNITKKSFYKTLISLIMNMILNILLIQKFGINGAAIATLITQFMALFLIDFFIEEYREQAIIQLKSFNTIYFFKNFKRILKEKGR